MVLRLSVAAWAFSTSPRVFAQLSPESPAPSRQSIAVEIDTLKTRLQSIEAKPGTHPTSDARIFLKGAEWALRYDAVLTAADLNQIQNSLVTATRRIEGLEAGMTPWTLQKGRLACGYVSKIDGSVQPYGLVVPQSYDANRNTRLDVVLHGSSQPVGMSETRFIARFDAGDDTANAPTDHDYIELHPLGRVENCYRWAGETDVFEAIEDVCRRYSIDRDRIVLRGMSMGASGTWHLGLKHPDQFVALGPYCGYVDTHRFSETPGMNFIRVGPLPVVQELGLHILDSVDYAANAGVVPEIAAIGDEDPFFQAHVIMNEAMQQEGLNMVNLISPGTGHVQDPVTWAEQMRRIKVYADKGRDRQPNHVRFVTWTLKYSRCYWISILGLRHQYERAEIEANLMPNSSVAIKHPVNITHFAIGPKMPCGWINHVSIGGVPIKLPKYPSGCVIPDIEFRLVGSRWQAHIMDSPLSLASKQPGLQGPIDDAFTTPFLCVRGTGKPWNAVVQSWADANLKRLAYEWARYFRGDLPIKDDTEVTSSDCVRCNLILFGDPGSNLWIRKALRKLPIHWTKTGVTLSTVSAHTGGNIAPVLICPSLFTSSRDRSLATDRSPRYLVINSGHTFHETELNRLNYLLFPRLGDWAVFRIGSNQPTNPSDPLDETLLGAGYFNERWN